MLRSILARPLYLFKCQLYDLTGVPPEWQKIMVKGGLLKDDADWKTVGVKEGKKLTMMGTADEMVKAPEKGPVFMEDLPEEEVVAVVRLGFIISVSSNSIFKFLAV